VNLLPFSTEGLKDYHKVMNNHFRKIYGYSPAFATDFFSTLYRNMPYASVDSTLKA
jgi:hypothetical protein